MKNDYINITKILSHLNDVIEKNVCSNCYVGTLPSALTDGADKMVVIDCGNATRDLHAYGKSTVNIYLYAATKGRTMNVSALAELEMAFKKAIDENKFDTEYYSVPNEVLLSGQGYDTTYNMHYLVKAIRLLIINV